MNYGTPHDEADFNVTREGSIFLFATLTEEARNYILDKHDPEPWQCFGEEGFLVEHGVAFALCRELIDEGFKVV